MDEYDIADIAENGLAKKEQELAKIEQERKQKRIEEARKKLQENKEKHANGLTAEEKGKIDTPKEPEL